MTGASDLPGEVVGVGIEDAPVVTPGEIRKRLDLLGDFIVYVGRIEREKGCARLFDEFARFVQEREPHLNLVLIGRPVLPVPQHVNITHLGVVSDAEKLSVIGASQAARPSQRRSRACRWRCSRPGRWSGRRSSTRSARCCAGRCSARAAGSTTAATRSSRRRCPGCSRTPRRRTRWAAGGRAYFERNYAWDVVMGKYERLLRAVAG